MTYKVLCNVCLCMCVFWVLGQKAVIPVRAVFLLVVFVHFQSFHASLRMDMS